MSFNFKNTKTFGNFYEERFPGRTYLTKSYCNPEKKARLIKPEFKEHSMEFEIFWLVGREHQKNCKQDAA